MVSRFVRLCMGLCAASLIAGCGGSDVGNDTGEQVEGGGECRQCPGDYTMGPSTNNVCKASPDAASCDTEIKSDAFVCGCDGNTYLNECQARVVGQSVEKKGACEDYAEGGEVDPEATNDDRSCRGCSAGISSMGPSTKHVCAMNPTVEACDAEPEAFVCGCDGNTYPKECTARVQGISVLHIGACE